MPTDTISINTDASTTQFSVSSPETTDSAELIIPPIKTVVAKTPEAPPSVVHILPNPAPYAQLCFRHDNVGSGGGRGGERLCILMVGGNNHAQRDLHCQYKPLVTPQGGDTEDSPQLGQTSSSQSSDTYSSPATTDDVMIVEDLGWASNGWHDLRSDSNDDDDSTETSRSCPEENDCWNWEKPPQDIVWQDEHWAAEATAECWNEMGFDSWRLLRDDSRGEDQTTDDMDLSLDIQNASECGGWIRGFGLCRFGAGPASTATWRPYHKKLNRSHAGNSSTEQQEREAAVDYLALP